ncbi:MAG TPA: sulfite exporter TauE/SafE family protein [Chloroflexota bacterium]|nr:sulfite exporter TauE/SafE family protein [Chloroflexota bacterium]
MDPRFTLIGLIIGFLIGLTGMGGGALMTPVMILVMGVKPVIAVGTDMVYGAVTKIVGGTAHWRQGTVHRKTGYLLGLGSVPATLLGVGVISAVERTNPELANVVLTRAVAWILIVVAVIMVAKPAITKVAQRCGMRRERDFRDDLQDLGDRAPWVLPIIGALVGFVVGLTSVGSGTLIIVSLLFLYPRWQSKDLVGTDVFHAAILGTGASIAEFAGGNVNVSMAASLLLGSIPGVLVGSRLAVGFPEQLLRFSLAAVLVVSGAKLL